MNHFALQAAETYIRDDFPTWIPDAIAGLLNRAPCHPIRYESPKRLVPTWVLSCQTTNTATLMIHVMTKDRFSFDADLIEDPDAITSQSIEAVLSGTYRSNWGRLKFAAHSSTYTAVVNMRNHLLPAAARIVESDQHVAERAFLLTLNHGNLISGPALGAVMLVAFAQESFVRLGFRLSEELRLRRSRIARERGIGPVLADSIATFDQAPFAVRLERLFKSLAVPKSFVPERAVQLSQFRNTAAHDEPLLYTTAGGEVTTSKGREFERRDSFGIFETLESSPCPVRLRHVKAAIDCHDAVVNVCLEKGRQAGWSEALNEFSEGIGLPIRDAFKGTEWYKRLTACAKEWETQYQPAVSTSLASFVEFRNALVRRSEMRRSR